MKIFVITLNTAGARQQQAAAQLRKRQLDFRFFPAVPGNEAVSSASCQVRHRDFLLATGRAVTPGEIGCFASHRLLWKLCVRLAEPILVMEDDFRLSEDFADALQQLANAIDEFGFIRLQSERRARKQQVRALGRFTLWRYTKAPNSAMCYGLSPAAADRLLAHADSIGAPVDIYMKSFWRHGQPMFGITPYSVSESELSKDSQIAGRSKARKSLATKLHRAVARLRELVARRHFNRSAG